MSGQTFLLNLFGGIALLLWSTRLVRTGIERAWGEQLRRLIVTMTKGRIRSCFAGIATATVLQSSTAASLLVVSFAQRGLIALAPALAVLLGADIGSTLVVQALSLNLSALVPVMLIIGVPLFMLPQSATLRQVGRIVIGLALMILSLGMIVAASDPLRSNAILVLVLEHLAGEPLLALIIGATLAWLLHSSVATVLLIVSLSSAGILSPALAVGLVLGANIGAGLVPLGLSLGASVDGKRVLVGNLAFRLIGALACVGFVEPIADLLRMVEANPGRLAANTHLAFNLALAIVFLPLTGVMERVLLRMMPEAQTAAADRPILHLDDNLFDRPAVALAAASREVMRQAEYVEIMVRETILAFGDGDDRRRLEIKAIDNKVDDLQEEIKLYLTRLTRNPLSDSDARKAFDLILFTTNLEHVGDIIDKSLLELANKKRRLHLRFSDEGWQEICAMHRRAVEQMRLAMTVFVTRDAGMARELVKAKDAIRDIERDATQNHLRRLRDGTSSSLETSSLHLDVLRDLKRIVAHLTSVAHPILEDSGELRSSRLAKPAAAAE